MKSIKVKNTEAYKDGEVYTIITCKGKLIIIYTSNELMVKISKGNFIKGIKPIIVSETEDHPNDLGYYDERLKCIVSSSPTWLPNKFCKVILALPENFSPKHLQAIVDGKLKDGDEVFVECERMYLRASKNKHLDSYEIKLNKENHIKLFPVNQEENWDNVFQMFWEDRTNNDLNGLKKYLKENYNPPTKKN